MTQSTPDGFNLPGQPPVHRQLTNDDLAAANREPSVVRVGLPPPSVAMAVGAHPDDIEFGCGATLAKWAAAGTEVHFVICTDGSKGTWDAQRSTSSLVAERQAEQREAASRLVGDRLGEVRFLERVDGELTNDHETRRLLVAEIRERQPEVLIGHDPWKRYRLHPDHRAAGLLICDAVVAARDPHFFPGGVPHRPSTLLLFEAQDIHHIEPVEEWIPAKLDALFAHRSQLVSTMGLEHPDDERGRAAFTARLTSRLQANAAPFAQALEQSGYRADVAVECFARLDDL
jgi:LmbE family N-acetylglucosaminyl deacetylase